ncbi:hypothetical protein ACTXT7_008452 [Hymenolepis weldensis]
MELDYMESDGHNLLKCINFVKPVDGGSSGKWAYLTIIGSALIHLPLRYDFTIGNMNLYLINYMNITAGHTVLLTAVCISAASVAMPLGGFLTKKIGFRVVVTIRKDRTDQLHPEYHSIIHKRNISEFVRVEWN